jgi:N-acetylglucosamine-6-sulfatase
MRARVLLFAIVLGIIPFVGFTETSTAAAKPNVFFYNLDDLRDAVPGVAGNVDPLQFMPKSRQWMSTGTRYTQNYVTESSCCPSRSAMMTGRYPHNNGIRLQSQGPNFDKAHSMACYLDGAGYATYVSGKFLTTWPKTLLPPCFDHSTVIWGGYNDVASKVDGVSKKLLGYSTTALGVRGREYITQALKGTAPFLLYETPQAPHWVEVTEPDGTIVRRAVPDTKYATTPVGTCAGPAETDKSDKPPYIRNSKFTTSQAQVMCQSQIRAIMTADDEFSATMQLLSDRGVLNNTLVILTSDNGYMWGEHGRTEKFVVYDPSVRVPLFVRGPGLSAGTNATRIVSQLDLLPTILATAGITLPVGAPALDGESLLGLGTGTRTAMYSEYFLDSSNGTVPTQRMVRTSTVKYIQTYDATGAVTFREYYNLVADPAENLNLLGDASTANDPPATTVTALRNRLNAFAVCAGATCLGTG